MEKSVHFGRAPALAHSPPYWGETVVKKASHWALSLSDCSLWRPLLCPLQSVPKWEGDIVYYHTVMTNKNMVEKTDPRKVPRKLCSNF